MTTKKYFGYKVNIDCWCDDSWREDKEWGSWGANYTQSFDRVSRCKDFPDIASILDIKELENCYVVWVCWSSGDSFGSASCSNAEAVGIFKDVESAKQLAHAVEHLCNFECGKMKDCGYGYKLTTKDGQEFEDGFCSWRGYFESVVAVNIETCVMRGE